MLYTGLDLPKSFSYTTTMNDKGQIVGQKKLPSNGEILEQLLTGLHTLRDKIAAKCWQATLI